MEKIKKWRNNYSNEIILEKEELVVYKRKKQKWVITKGKKLFSHYFKFI